MRNLVLFAVAVALAGSAALAHADEGNTVYFPTDSDTWVLQQYPSWGHAGDTVYGIHTVSLPSVSHVDITLNFDENTLPDSSYVDLDCRIASRTIGTLHITRRTGLVGNWAFDFEPISPPFELQLYETNNLIVPPISSLNLNSSRSNVYRFGPQPTPTETRSWGRVKSLYR